MFGLPPQSIDVSAHGGTDKAYVFGFAPGDLGKKRFADVRFQISGDALDTTYANSPITELNGKPFRYVREKEGSGSPE